MQHFIWCVKFFERNSCIYISQNLTKKHPQPNWLLTVIWLWQTDKHWLCNHSLNEIKCYFCIPWFSWNLFFKTISLHHKYYNMHTWSMNFYCQLRHLYKCYVFCDIFPVWLFFKKQYSHIAGYVMKLLFAVLYIL